MISRATKEHVDHLTNRGLDRERIERVRAALTIIFKCAQSGGYEHHVLDLIASIRDDAADPYKALIGPAQYKQEEAA